MGPLVGTDADEAAFSPPVSAGPLRGLSGPCRKAAPLATLRLNRCQRLVVDSQDPWLHRGNRPPLTRPAA